MRAYKTILTIIHKYIHNINIVDCTISMHNVGVSVPARQSVFDWHVKRDNYTKIHT